jgi:hypothetical protein
VPLTIGVGARRWFEASTRLVEAMGQIESVNETSTIGPPVGQSV